MVLSREQSITLFRILQEILTNVARHAQATNVQITLGQYGEHVSLQVEDNGRGMTGVEQSGPKHSACWGCASALNSKAVPRHSGRVGNWNTGHRPDPNIYIGQPMINILLADDHPVHLRRGSRPDFHR